MTDAMILINKVVIMGKISNDNKQYCYCTTFTVAGNGYVIYSDVNKKSDRLVLMNDKNVTDRPI